jgi:hypothetical protein
MELYFTQTFKMKALFTVVVLVMIIISGTTSSCEKEVIKPGCDTVVVRDTIIIRDTITASVNYPIEGLWIGTYTINSEPSLGKQYFSFIIKPNGVLICETSYIGKQHLSPGTWSLNGNTLSCSFTCVYGLPQHIGITEVSTAQWDSKLNKLEGTWKNLAPLTGSGNITMSRVN